VGIRNQESKVSISTWSISQLTSLYAVERWVSVLFAVPCLIFDEKNHT
jgi:hypothetical protein